MTSRLQHTLPASGREEAPGAHDADPLRGDPRGERTGAAVRVGDLETAGRLLAGEPGLVHVRREQAETPLHRAAAAGHVDLARLLLSHGAAVDGSSTGWEWRPLVHAAWHGHVEMVRLLLAGGADPTRSGGQPLHYAGQRRHREVCRLLVEAGAVDDIVQPPDAETLAVFRAAYRYDAPALAKLLEKNPRLATARDVDGRTPMHEAATHGDVESVRVLIQAGADVAARDRDGVTALDRAVSHSQADVAALLLSHGAASDLFTAIRFGAAERVIELLSADTSLLHTRDELGRTPLQVAARSCRKPAVRVLLDRGAEDPHGAARAFVAGAVTSGEDLSGASFQDCRLFGTVLDNVNLGHASIHNANMSGAAFYNVNLSGARIDHSCIDGLTIWGVEVRPLIEAELARRRGEGS